MELFDKARSCPVTRAREFLVYGGDRMTFAQVFDAVDALGNALLSRFGVKRGDRCDTL